MRTVFFVSLITALISCQKPLTGKEMVTQSIEAHGFTNQLDSLSYHKTTQLFYPDGSLEKSIVQAHHISWKPFTYSIEQVNKITHYKNGRYFLSVDGVEEDSIQGSKKAEKAVKTAYFVFWQPAKLLDSKAIITYLGQRKIEEDQQVDAVEVRYPKSNSTDEWVFYFDPKSKLNLGYSVKHNGRWNLILNDAFHLDHQPILVKERRSFFIDSLKKTSILRAAYTYQLLP